MTLATHRTQAPAARKRGGGPAQDLQMNASAHGRHPLPEGGEINSLCRAAAGIIPSLPAGSGANVYPTECVRGAAEIVHRSANPHPPAAQPVKGYKCSRNSTKRASKNQVAAPSLTVNDHLLLQHHRSEMCAQKRIFQLSKLFSLSITPNIPSIALDKLLTYRLRKCGPYLHSTEHGDVNRAQLVNWDSLKHLRVRPPFQVFSPRQVGLYCLFTEIQNRLIKDVDQPFKQSALALSQLEERHSQLVGRPPFLCSLMNERKRARSNDRDNRANRLHPVCRTGQQTKEVQNSKQDPTESKQSSEPPRHPHAGHHQAFPPSGHRYLPLLSTLRDCPLPLHSSTEAIE